MNRIFADTSYFVALMLKNDDSHERALDLTSGFSGITVTTEWVFIELANYFGATIHRQRIGDLIDNLRRQPRVHIITANATDFERGFLLFKARPDKLWSLVDCISIELARGLDISDILTSDHHFTQAGFNALLIP